MLLDQQADHGGGGIGADGATAIVRQRDARALDLTLAGLAAQLFGQFNDLRAAGGNRTSAQVLADIGAFSKIFPSKSLINSTIPPATSSTDAWATVANQTADANSAAWQAVNTAIAAGVAGYGAVIDVASATKDAVSTDKWKAPGFTTDGLHGTASAYAAISAIETPVSYAAVPPSTQFSMFSITPTVSWLDVSNLATTPTTGLTALTVGGPYNYAGTAT